MTDKAEQQASTALQHDPDRDHAIVWECIYDHGNGKFMGQQSAQQRARAFDALRRLRAAASREG